MWWTKKYNLPSNHELFQSRNIFDLTVEYHLDIIQEHPLEAYRGENGSVQFRDTGDEVIDQWEQQIADGFEPDLAGAFAPGELAKIQRRLKKADRYLTPKTFGDVAKITASADQSRNESPASNPFSVFGKK